MLSSTSSTKSAPGGSTIKYTTVSLNAPPSRIEFDDGTRTLLLRAAQVEDADAIYEAVMDSLTELRQFFSWAHAPISLETQRARLAENLASQDTASEISFLVYEREDGPLVGSISLIRQRILNPRGAELGYWIRSSAAGRGLTTLAARCLCVVAFDYCACTRMQCFYDEENIGSQRVAEKSGFQVEARLRKFGVVATAETRRQGDITTDYTILSALFPEDLGNFPWYENIQKHLRVFNGKGDPARPSLPG